MHNDQNRIKIGILFYFKTSWMGGIQYIINVINTLNYLDEDNKPEIYLFYYSDLKRFLADINYPYLKAIEWNFPSIIKGNFLSFVKMKNVFIHEILKNYNLNAIYPLHDFPVRTKTDVKLIDWCADLQHKHYPEFFTRSQIMARNIRLKLALRNNDDMVLSSQDVLDDFKKFFRYGKNVRMHIFHFVSVIPELENLSFDDLKKKYNLPDKYFMISNQFHRHKNHKILFLALAKLKEKGIAVHLALTGKFPKAANSPYIDEIHKVIKEFDLGDQITFLGLISRNDQLLLMKYSQAVIQPSLFEGWSTVIEDAKSLQVPVIASDLKVNIEQLGEDGVYFNPHNSEQLASILSDFPGRNFNELIYEDYSKRINKAAKELLDIFCQR